jgi:hypothetical protein
MSFSNQNTLHGTVLQLKEIVTNLQAECPEAARQIHQMEALVLEIDRKTCNQGNSHSATSVAVGSVAISAPAPAGVAG